MAASRSEDFLLHEVKPDQRGSLIIFEVGGDGIANVGVKLFQSVGLGEDRNAQRASGRIN